MAVSIQNRQRRVRRLGLRGLRRRAEAVLASLRSGHESVGVVLVSDRAMRPLNRRFRGHDETTDVLSFPLRYPKGSGGEEGAYLGDVVISVEEAARQAEEDGETLAEALDRLLIHGILHLKGHDHHTPREAARMRRQERRLGETLGKMRRRERAGRR